MYTIGEVEKITGISRDRLRNYEKNGILNPGKGEENNYRKYSEKDILDVMGVEYFRMMDLSIKEISSIYENGRIEHLHSLICDKLDAMNLELQQLMNQIKMLDNFQDMCQRIRNEADCYSIRPMFPFRIVGTLTETKAFEEYPFMRSRKNQDMPMLKSIMRKIEFNSQEITENMVFIIEECNESDEGMQKYEKCVYTITTEKVAGKDIQDEMLEKTMKYIQDNQYEPYGCVFIKPMIMTYSLQEAVTYLEIFVPVK